MSVWPIPIINLTRCTGCGLCIEVCPVGALSVREKQALVSNPDACTYTGNYELICPEHAITRPFEIVFDKPSEE